MLFLRLPFFRPIVRDVCLDDKAEEALARCRERAHFMREYARSTTQFRILPPRRNYLRRDRRRYLFETVAPPLDYSRR